MVFDAQLVKLEQSTTTSGVQHHTLRDPLATVEILRVGGDR
jgi:hypothetical protein